MPDLLSFKRELYRKLVHSLSIFIPIIYLFVSKNTMIFVILFFSIMMITIDYYRRYKNFISLYFNALFSKIVRKNENNKPMSATYLIIAALIIIVLVPEQLKFIPILSISYCSICDTSAAIFGMKYGKIKIINNKTLEGTLAFVISCIMMNFLFIVTNIIPYNSSIFIIFIYLPILLSIVELFTKTEYDNLTVPLFGSFLLYFIF